MDGGLDPAGLVRDGDARDHNLELCGDPCPNIDRLRETEERLRLIAEHIEDVFYILRREGTISYVSRGYERIWGRSEGELQDGHGRWPDAVHPEDRARVERAMINALRGDPLDEEYRISRPDGRTRWVRDRAFPVENDLGEVQHLVGVAQDITNEKVLEQELRHAQKMEAIGVLASGIAHDFNNVLQAIMGCVQVALGDEGLGERGRTYLERAKDAAKRGGALTSQLLTFGRKQQVEPKPISIDGVIESSAKLLERLLGEHIALSIEQRATSGIVMADTVQIQQVLMNLAANARDAMPSGGNLLVSTDVVTLDPTEAACRELPTLRCVRIKVRDTGSGMDDATRARIFEPFYTTKRPDSGTGLGLSTVFGICKRLRGYVEVDSVPGAGTTFTVHLPCTEHEAEQEATQRRVVLPSASVLLIEDEPLVRSTIRHHLAELGFHVLEAENLEETLAVCRAETRIDLLITDVMMPKLIGPRFAEQLRKERPGLRTLYISAHPRSALIDTGIVEPDELVLQKPFDKDDLAAKLLDVLGPLV